MRKPLVVVSAAASAMVLGGILVATSADAEETPDTPGWVMPDLSSFFGGPSDDDGFFDAPYADGPDSPAGDDAPGSHGSAPHDGTPGARPDHPQGNTPDFSDMSSGQGWSAGQRPAAQTNRGPMAGTQDQAAPGSGAAAPGAQRQRPALSGDGADSAQSGDGAGTTRNGDGAGTTRNGDGADSARNGDGAQRSGTLSAAARRDVTVADVSTSPSSPVQQQVLTLVNQNRRRHGCDGLSLDRRLIDAANEHAADMARRRYFAHESPNGAGAGDRVRDAGYRWRRYGENIARGADNPYEVVNGWMHSPSHRENILDCRLHQMGVGLAIADDTPYWVQDFATPM